MIKYKPEAEQHEIESLTNAFAKLKEVIPVIQQFKAVLNISPENLDKGFKHIYVVTFKNASDRDAYLIHPEHKKFGEYAGKLGIIEDVMVVDY